jgi:predicted DNA-binding transcriptional regulator YafY
VLRGPAGGIHVPGRSTPFIEVIRFAASNHLLVDLDYRDEEGNRRIRAIEPYSLRRTKDANIILCAVNVEKQEARSYRLERIQGATILNRGFTPRFQIELTPSGPLVAPDTARNREAGGRQRSAATRRAGTAWPKTTHLYRCLVCGKRFERTSMDATLRAHKNPSGYPCGGRHGIYEGTR